MKFARIVRAIPLLFVGVCLSHSVLISDAGAEMREESEIDYASSGFYVWLGAGIGVTTEGSDIGGSLLPLDVSTAGGFNGRVGSATRYLALELQFEYLPTFEASAAGLPVAEWSMFAMTGNAKIQLPLGRFQPYLMVGGGMARASTSFGITPGLDGSSYSGVFRGGGGVNVYVTEHIALAADATYVLPFDDNDGLDYVSIGLGAFYKF
jgi:opacity protein-like surface antigen